MPEEVPMGVVSFRCDEDADFDNIAWELERFSVPPEDARRGADASLTDEVRVTGPACDIPTLARRLRACGARAEVVG